MSELLSSLSEGLAEVVERTSPYVLRVEGRDRLAATGIVWAPSEGAGRGLVVTAHHALERDERIVVGLPDGRAADAEIVGRDPATDLAALRPRGVELPEGAPWERGDDLRVGHIVLALGRPGHSIQATFGVVSALDGPWRTPGGGRVDHYLQPDLVMYPGFSGGPLVGVDGVIRGMNTSGLLRTLSLTMPASTVSRVVHSLLEHGRVRRARLGVRGQPARLPSALAREVGQETGLLLVEVEPGTAADRGGLVMGDTLVALDDTPIRTVHDLLALLDEEIVGRTVTIKLVRGGAVRQAQVTIGEATP